MPFSGLNQKLGLIGIYKCALRNKDFHLHLSKNCSILAKF